LELFESVPSEIRDAYKRAYEVLGPAWEIGFAWAEATGFRPAELAEIRAKIEAQIAREREVLAAKLAGYRRGDLSAGEFAAWVDLLTPDAILRHAGVAPSSVPPSR
jgi:hypothetical protein